MALVLVSAVTVATPGSASVADAAVTPDATCVVSVEHLQKVSKDDVAALWASMTTEWKAVLTAPEDLSKRDYQSPGCP